MFIDTGLEYPEIRNFVKTADNVTWIKPEMNFKKVVETYGYPIISKEVSKRVYWGKKYINENGRVGEWAYKTLTQPTYTKDGKRSPYDVHRYEFLLYAPFKISDKCCNVMKKDTAHKYEKDTGNKPIIATMTQESQLRKSAWLINGCNVFDSEHPKSTPTAFWTEQDVLEYLVCYDIPYSPIYGEIVKDDHGKWITTGCDRTGCMFCGFGCHLEKEPNRFQRLKVTHPKTWEWIMKPWDEGGLGMRQVLEFIGVKVE